MHARIIEPTEHVADGGFMLPYRHLAIRVLASALRDVCNPGGSATDRESARVFFAGSRMLFHWCRLAALDPQRIVRHVATITADGSSGINSRRAVDAKDEK